jgi:serine/threonine-protein kinase
MRAAGALRSSPEEPEIRGGTTPAGAKRFGDYVLYEQLGRGGMAIVHRAESRKADSLGRVVALKRLAPHNPFDFDFDLVRSFIEEARLATRFDHDNLARTYSLGKSGGTYFIEMEYVPGPTLLQLARQCEVAAGAMPVAVIVQILIQVCAALEHVHGLCDDRGNPLALIHRDVSPSNIIVSNGGVVKLIDFGIVKGHSAQASTVAGTIKGKLAYIAPEYLNGRLDQRSDLYAVGVIAHEMLTDRRLFQGRDDLETIARVRDLRIAPPSRSRAGVPPALDAIVMTALQRDPDRRWQTACELRTALEGLQAAGDGPELIDTWTSWAITRDPRPESPELFDLLDALVEPTIAVERVLPPAVEPVVDDPPHIVARTNALGVSLLAALLAVVLALISVVARS